MKRRFLASCLLPVALTLGVLAVVSGAPSATAVTQLKIMVNGDSVTQEFNGDYTWRFRLVREVARQSAIQGNGVDFVGPNKWPYGGSQYYRVSGWDTDHDAIGGSRLYQHLAPDGAYKITDQVTPDLDVLISFLGTNDLLQGIETTGVDDVDAVATMVQGVVDNYATFIDQVRAIAPDVKIVLGEVMTHQIPSWVRKKYNAALAAQVVVGKDQPNSPIALAALNADVDAAKWASTAYTYDGIHPTPTGEMVIAKRFAEALQEVAPEVLPDALEIPLITVIWNPVFTPAVRVASRRIYLTATTSMKQSGILGLRVKLYTARTKRTVVGYFQLKTGWYSSRLRPGYYKVAAQGMRASMTTPWTRWYTVRIR